MYKFTAIFLLFFLSGCGDKEITPPNIIYILADDLGYGELGVYGQEIIETPHIDALAIEGMRFTQHYSGAPVCAPARCVLLTGQHTGHAYVRGNDEWGERGKVWDYQAMYDDPFLEGQRPLPDSLITIAEVLKTRGYTTGMVGKWGLGAPTTEGVPNNQGFDFFYGYNCQRQAHTYYPMHLWKNEQRDILDNKFVKLHANLPEKADPNDSKSYADFNLNDYAPTKMHEEALSFIKENKDGPFFFYYASPIPHLPLQAPEKWVNHYREKLGPEEPYTGNSYFPCQYPRATYAAMISYLDEQVGDLVQTLKDLGLYDNTLIIFSSDNGPTYTGGADTPYFNSAKPFLTDYGWGKGFTHEGGIRVPMIATWPEKIKANSTSDHISAFHDVMATLSEVCGAEIPSQSDGISFLPSLLGKSQPRHDYLFWDYPEYGGQQAVRMGKWKGIRKNINQGNLDIELYDLETDIQEQNNIADKHPEVVLRIEDIMKKARTEPVLDRFKMEALGDVKVSFIEARKRVEELSTDASELSLGEGYFVLNQRTRTTYPEAALEALMVLQERLTATGGYTLREAEEDKLPIIQFIDDAAIKNDHCDLEISTNGIVIRSGTGNGFLKGVKTLLQLMDPKIYIDHEMHNPAWTIACAEIKL
jgi:arylsulfatase